MTPPEFGPVGFDPSMFLMTGYLLTVLTGLIAVALGIGVVSLPAFFAVLFVFEQSARLASEATGAFVFKVVLVMFRGLRRSPLRTSLTYLALFVLTAVLALIYSVLAFIGRATADKEANFKAVITHRTIIPSQMPPGYYDRFKQLCLEELPPEMRPVNGDADIMSWSFVGGSTDPVSKKPENALFMFSMEPRKILTMMDGLDDLTGKEKETVTKSVADMEANKQAIVVSQTRLKKMNLKVGQKIKLYGLNYPDMTFEFDIVGTLPDGKYEGVGFMNKAYLDQLLKTKPADYLMQSKALNLIWVRLPNKTAFERLSALADDPKHFSNPQIKMETASSGIGSWLDAYKDIFFGMKFILCPSMVGIMSLVVANAISIGVRERRTEMAVLKVLGFQPWHVMGLVLGEALLVGALAGGMSALICWGWIGNIKFQVAFFGAFFVPPEVLVYGPVLGVLVAFAGSIGPALSAKNVRVAEVFAKVA